MAFSLSLHTYAINKANMAFVTTLNSSQRNRIKNTFESIFRAWIEQSDYYVRSWEFHLRFELNKDSCDPYIPFGEQIQSKFKDQSQSDSKD